MVELRRWLVGVVHKVRQQIFIRFSGSFEAIFTLLRTNLRMTPTLDEQA